VDSILEDIFNFATLIPRVARLEVPDYLEDVEEMDELSDIRDEILRRVSLAITKVGKVWPNSGCSLIPPSYFARLLTC